MNILALIAITAFSFLGISEAKADDCQGAMSATLNSMSDAITYGKAVGNNCKNQTTASVAQHNAAAVAQSIDANQTNYSSSQYYGRDLNLSLQAGNSKISKCSGDLSGLSNKDKADCEAVEFAAKNGNQRPKYNIDRINDPVLSASERQMTQANISSNQDFCRIVRNVVPATYEKKQCMVTASEVQDTCSDYIENTQCYKDTGNYNVSSGGVVFDSLKLISTNHPQNRQPGNTFIRRIYAFPPQWFAFNNKNLVISQEGNASYAPGSYDAEYSFEIKNIAQMDKAIIRSYDRDDGLRVFVNGHMVIDDSYGRESAGYREVNKDIKPYLTEGLNVIKTQVYNNKRQVRLNMRIDIPVYRGECQINLKTTCAPKHKSPLTCKITKTVCEQNSSNFYDKFGSIGQEKMGYCTNKKYEMSCKAPMISECSALDTKGCEQIGSECTERDQEGNCLTYNQTYQCKKTPERVIETTQCEQKLCNGANCIGDPPPEADGDFGKAIAIMEAQRQAGIYGKTPTGYNIFDGDPSVCSVKVLAGHSVMSCCKEISTGNKFQNRTQGASTPTYGNAPNQPGLDNRGSQYVYDDVFNQNKTLSVIQSTATLGWLQCNDEEKILAIKRGSGLCEYSHEWCSKKTFFGSCIEKKRQYCCYRSTLARIINQQGRAQLGKGGCDGFTLEELQKLDFSKMDFSEFINEIVPADIDVEQRKQKVQKTVEQNFGKEVNYYER